MKIDAQVYFWKYLKSFSNLIVNDNKLLQQNYLPEQFSLTMHRNNVSGCLAFTSEPLEVETRFLAELAFTHPFILGVIGGIDLTDIKTLAKMEELRRYPSIRGFQAESRGLTDSLQEVMDQLREYQYSLDLRLSPDSNIPALCDWVASYPDQSFILQHAGNPDTKHAPASFWVSAIRMLAKNQNFSCKVSGLFEQSNWKSWKPTDLYPFLEVLFDSFGPGRLLYASDWPFILIAGVYVQWKSLLEKFTDKYSVEERSLFFGENARRIYRI